MNTRIPTRIPALCMLAGAALLLASPASAQRAGQSMTVQTGVVVGARAVDLQSEAGRGAAIGGVAGLAMTGSNRSSSRRIRNTALGAGTGALIANSAQGSRNGMQYTIQTAPGTTITVITDQTQIRIGDCVNVEQGGSTANVRRVAQSLCEMARDNEVDQEITSHIQEEADRCLQAKDQMLDAETDEAFELALRRVEFFCND